MFSFDKGKPFAEIQGGEYDSQILCVLEQPPKRNFDVVKDVELEDEGQLIPIPDPNMRQILYIAAPEGSGKSFYAGLYMEGWRELFPKNSAYVFSRKPLDDVIDVIGVKRVMLDETLISDPIDFLQEMQENDLVLFDDIDTVTNKKVKDAIYKLEADIIDVGRAHKVYVISTSHLINGNDRARTRTLLNSAHFYIIFPIGGNTYQITYLLKNYVGMSKDFISEILDSDSRWVTISRKYPPYVFGQKFARMIK